MFSSRENKQMIWNLLLSQTKPEAINNTRFQEYFEQLVEQIGENITRFPSLVAMNKELLTLSLQGIRALSMQKPSESDSTVYQKRLIEKQKELKIMKEGGIKPKEIDFTDLNGGNYSDVNLLMSRSQEQRARELEKISRNYKQNNEKALEWINSEDRSSLIASNKIKETEVSKKLVIHGTSVDNKKVSFNLEKQKSNICVKLSYTEDGINKKMICNLSNGFRVFMSAHGKIEEKANIVLENVELFTN